jgi:hypothetical protein
MEKGEKEWSFEKSYNTCYRQDHIKTLQTPGTTLTDIDIMNLFYLMVWKKGYTPDDVRCIDSQVVSMIMRWYREGTSPTNREPIDLKTINRTKNLFTENVPPLLFLPLCCGGHWSLLYYRKESCLWTHMDSLYPMHLSYAKEVLRALKEWNYLTLLPWDGTINHFSGMTHQPQSWECGIYLLLYMLVVLESTNDGDIKRNLYYTNDRSRRELTQTLLKII